MKPRDTWALMLLSALWGGSFLCMRVAAPVLGPVVLIEGRVLLAGGILLVYVALRNWKPDAVEWYSAQRLPEYAPRRFRKHKTKYMQLPLLNDEQASDT